jgi:hypothetical protein
MARIRSIHPGLWTDETYVALSMPARLLFLGIWNECDDMGSFEWSPLKLKMRLLPADNVDPVELLDELTAARCIMPYDAEGKRYGAVRNFCQYQRPKKPTSVYPQTEAVGNWVNINARSTRDGGEPTPSSDTVSGEPTPRSKRPGGEGTPPSTQASGEVVGNQLPTSGEKSRQRKEGGDNTVPNGTAAIAAIDPAKALFDAGVALLMAAGSSRKQSGAMIARWRKDHGDRWTREAIASAAGKSDPIGWIEGRKKNQIADEDEAREISRATAERYRRLYPSPPAALPAQLESAVQ